MATNFPTSLDVYADKSDNVDDVMASHINDPQDAIKALQAKVGVNNSAVATSHDYKISQLETGVVNPGSSRLQFTSGANLSTGERIRISNEGKVVAPVNIPVLQAEAVADTGTYTWHVAGYDTTNNKILFLNGDFAMVGTVSGDSVSFGTPVAVPDTGGFEYMSISFSPDDGRFLIAYNYPTGSVARAVVAIISGSSVSFGSTTDIEANECRGIDTVYIGSSKFAITYVDGNATGDGKAVIATISGTSVSLGSAVGIDGTTNTQNNTITYDSVNDKVLIAYTDDATQTGKAVVGTVSGTSISFGTPVEFDSGNTDVGTSSMSCSYDTASGNILISYVISGTGAAIISGTISGTSISFGTKSSLQSGVASDSHLNTICADNLGCLIIGWVNNDSNRTEYIVVIVASDNSLEKSNITTSANNQNFLSMAYDEDSKRFFAGYEDSTSSDSYGRMISVIDNSVALGNMDEAASIGEIKFASLNGSLSAGHTGLSINTDYYLDNANALTTTIGFNKFVGIAISSTQLLLYRKGRDSIITGVSSWNPSNSSDTLEITHNLGSVPLKIRIRYFAVSQGDDRAEGEGVYDGENTACVYEYKSGNPRQSAATSDTYIIVVDNEALGSFNWSAEVTSNGANSFILTPSNFSNAESIVFLWEIQG